MGVIARPLLKVPLAEVERRASFVEVLHSVPAILVLILFSLGEVCEERGVIVCLLELDVSYLPFVSELLSRVMTSEAGGIEG